MPGKTILGALVTGFVLFNFGFIFWAINPLPYMAWNDVADPAAAQAAAAEIFPEDGVYFLPGAGNDEAAIKLLETGPSVYVTIDHSPALPGDPASLGIGFVHNIFSAFLLVFLFSGVYGLGPRVSRALVVGIVATFIINGSEIIWWQQPSHWIVHQVIYYLLYFAIGALVLNFFLPKSAED